MRNHNNNNNSNHNNYSEERFNGRDFLLKQSYSFGFKWNLASERMVMEPATTSPWRYRRGNFWSKRPSLFGSITKPRVFSFHYYKGMKSPILPIIGKIRQLRQRCRRTKSMTSPMFMRSSVVIAGAAAFSSSRLRCGDPEALLSPNKFNRSLIHEFVGDIMYPMAATKLDFETICRTPDSFVEHHLKESTCEKFCH
ncbi:ring-h2 finger protein atl65 [Quercus suber]|uniref:Ring-h2 finger protein atl65 n=1 Tax=Quercus suber TaxID=58331 RepID=A0AAW0LZK3_QUESU